MFLGLRAQGTLGQSSWRVSIPPGFQQCLSEVFHGTESGGVPGALVWRNREQMAARRVPTGWGRAWAGTWLTLRRCSSFFPSHGFPPLLARITSPCPAWGYPSTAMQMCRDVGDAPVGTPLWQPFWCPLCCSWEVLGDGRQSGKDPKRQSVWHPAPSRREHPSLTLPLCPCPGSASAQLFHYSFLP